MQTRLSQIAMAATLLLASAASSSAQNYPAKPVRVIVPLSAGSVTDLAIRAVGVEMATHTGQPWIVDNRPGGAMVIGADVCAKAAPDGYTLCVVSSDTMSFNPYTMPNLPYDPERDFKPITNLFYVIEGIIATSAVPAGSIAELKTAAAAKSLNFGTLGPGSTPDVFRLWLNDRWKAKFVDVAYKGGGDVATALFKAEIDVARIGLGNIAAQLGDGKVKVLAVSSDARSPLLPNAPTLTEVGLGEYPVRVWWGLVAPAATPDAIVDKVNADLNQVLREPKTASFLSERYLETKAGTKQEFAAFLKTDRSKIGDLLKHYNIQHQ